MSSPSSSASAPGKRKRTTETTAAKLAMQGSSRDASAEEGDSTAAEVSGRPSLDIAHVSKRQRSGTHGASGGESTADGDDGAEGNDVDDESEEGPMAPPPLGMLTHPVGYKTNDPPVGRKVRVYADGVFDLCHLG